MVIPSTRMKKDRTHRGVLLKTREAGRVYVDQPASQLPTPQLAHANQPAESVAIRSQQASSQAVSRALAPRFVAFPHQLP